MLQIAFLHWPCSMSHFREDHSREVRRAGIGQKWDDRPEIGLSGSGWYGQAAGMDNRPWLLDLLELAELLLELGQRDDADRVLEQLEAEELSVSEAVERLRRLH